MKVVLVRSPICLKFVQIRVPWTIEFHDEKMCPRKLLTLEALFHCRPSRVACMVVFKYLFGESLDKQRKMFCLCTYEASKHIETPILHSKLTKKNRC